MSYDGTVIVGYGQTPYHKNPQLPTIWYVVNAIRLALKSAGIDKRDVDGLGVSSFLLPPDNISTIAEHMGMTLRWGYSGAFGGASQVIGLMRGIRAIQQGDANVIVLASADSYSMESHKGLMSQFNTGMRDYLAPFGMGGANGLFAMVEQRHRHEFGTTREQLGKIAVNFRYNAGKNPNALLRSPLTIEDYLNARIICEPLRLYDCVLPCGGGEAVVIVSEKLTNRINRPAIRVLSGGERTNYQPKEIIVLETGFKDLSPKLFRDAGLSPNDISILELYDDYPIMVIIQLEDLGFCKKGGGGHFVEETNISLNGSLPINTGGGQLSCGQCGAGGGGIGLTEAVLQLQNEAGERQIFGAKTALVTGFGMVGFVKGLCQAAVILTNS